MKQLELILNGRRHNLIRGLETRLASCGQRLVKSAQTLDTLSPLSTLNRGYSITLQLPERRLLRDARDATPGDRIETRLASGRILSRVEKSMPDPGPT